MGHSRFFLVAVFLLINNVFPGISGKISGILVDADSGSPMSGVNILVRNTSLGSVSDSDGSFTILNLPPGIYDIDISMIGYAKHSITGVEVKIDQTTIISVKMIQKSIEMATVTVQAKRPIVIPDISNSQINISSKEIETLPFDEIIDVIGLQSGIEGMSVRGGGSRESLFQVDGISYNDERSNVPYTSLPMGIIQEVQVQTGGFNAEYGNIRSGIVNVILAEGNKDRIHGGFTFRHSPPAQKHFGTSLFSRNSYFLRPFLDDNVAWSGTENGNWDAYTKRQYPSFEGWNAIADATLNDNDLSNDMTPKAAQQIFKWEHRRYGVIQHPDENVDFYLKGPVPYFSKNLGALRFLISYRSENEAFVFPLSFKNYDDKSTLIKLTADFSRKTKFNFSFQSGTIQSVSPYNWKTTPTGYFLRTTYEVANLLNSSSGNSILFMPGYFSPTKLNRSIVGFRLTHMVSEKEFFDIVLQLQSNIYDTYQTLDRDTSKQYAIIPGNDHYLADEAPYGYWGHSVTGINGMNIGGWMNLGRDQTKNSTVILKSDYTNQYKSNHQIKAGIGAVINSYKIRSYAQNPGMSTWNRSMVYDVMPFRTYFYIQDKVEYEGFIANLGLRTDLSNANSEVYNLDLYDESFKQGLGNEIETNADTKKSRPNFALSPRLGISHPITEKSKLYFNYGHFYSEPSSSYRFRLQRESNGLVTHLGDPNMDFEKTVAYEVGFSSNPFGNYLFNLALFYKDITNQPGWIYYQNMNGTVQVNRIENNNYEDIRGVELTLKKNIGDWITGMINYTYLVQSSGYFGLLRQFQDPNMQRDYESLNQYQSKPRPRPYLRAVINLKSPNNFGPKLMKTHLLGEWTSSFIFNYKTGSYETYNPQNIPGVSDNVQWEDSYNTNLRVSKRLRWRQGYVDFILDVRNLFNNQFLSYAGFADYYDYIDYLESLRFSWEDGKEKGNDRIGKYRDWSIPYQPYEPDDWENPTPEDKKILDSKAYIDMPNIRAVSFLNPRDIYFGISIHF